MYHNINHPIVRKTFREGVYFKDSKNSIKITLNMYVPEIYIKDS